MNKDGIYKRHSHRVGLHYIGTLRCNERDVAPLSEVECDLLHGILSEADRYDVYSTPGKLEWGRSLKVGNTALAQLPKCGPSDGEEQHQYTTAVIRWCVSMVVDGYKFGIEIMVSSYICTCVYIIYQATKPKDVNTTSVLTIFSLCLVPYTHVLPLHTAYSDEMYFMREQS